MHHLISFLISADTLERQGIERNAVNISERLYRLQRLRYVMLQRRDVLGEETIAGTGRALGRKGQDAGVVWEDVLLFVDTF